MKNTALKGCCFKLQISTKDSHPTQQPKLFQLLKSRGLAKNSPSPNCLEKLPTNGSTCCSTAVNSYTRHHYCTTWSFLFCKQCLTVPTKHLASISKKAFNHLHYTKSTRRTKPASAQMCSLPNCINPCSLNVYWATKALANWRVLHQNHGFGHKVLHQHVLFQKFCTKWSRQVASQL